MFWKYAANVQQNTHAAVWLLIFCIFLEKVKFFLEQLRSCIDATFKKNQSPQPQKNTCCWTGFQKDDPADKARDRSSSILPLIPKKLSDFWKD